MTQYSFVALSIFMELYQFITYARNFDNFSIRQ
jgi:hypothetical protein